VLAAACLLGFTACASQPLRPDIVSDQAVVLALPVAMQDELYECGLVSISALCRYHGIEIPQAERERLMHLAAEKQGLSGAELRETLEPLGMEVFIFPGTLDRQPTGLYAQLDAGRPVLVMTLERFGSPHFSLVSGYDEAYGNIHVLDPRRGAVMWPVAAFERLWDRAQRFALLAVPKQGAAGGDHPPARQQPAQQPTQETAP
jgi:ABC-type bacteriocin/lantibiotic exporter with double-glycine peptidase domain